MYRWLHGLIDTYAEPNPDKPEVHLPIGMKTDVHNMYMDEVRFGNDDLHPVSSNYFNAVWRERVPHLKVRVFHRFHITFCPLPCVSVSVQEIVRCKHSIVPLIQVCSVRQMHRDRRSLAKSYNRRGKANLATCEEKAPLIRECLFLLCLRVVTLQRYAHGFAWFFPFVV